MVGKKLHSDEVNINALFKITFLVKIMVFCSKQKSITSTGIVSFTSTANLGYLLVGMLSILYGPIVYKSKGFLGYEQ